MLFVITISYVLTGPNSLHKILNKIGGWHIAPMWLSAPMAVEVAGAPKRTIHQSLNQSIWYNYPSLRRFKIAPLFVRIWPRLNLSAFLNEHLLRILNKIRHLSLCIYSSEKCCHTSRNSTFISKHSFFKNFGIEFHFWLSIALSLWLLFAVAKDCHTIKSCLQSITSFSFCS